MILKSGNLLNVDEMKLPKKVTSEAHFQEEVRFLMPAYCRLFSYDRKVLLFYHIRGVGEEFPCRIQKGAQLACFVPALKKNYVLWD